MGLALLSGIWDLRQGSVGYRSSASRLLRIARISVRIARIRPGPAEIATRAIERKP
jgi:hypothetical protein